MKKERLIKDLRELADYIEKDCVKVMPDTTMRVHSYDEERHIDGMYSGRYPTGSQLIEMYISLDNRDVRMAGFESYKKDLANETP